MLLIGHFCAALCAATLAIGGGSPLGVVDAPFATSPVTFYGVQVGVYVDDQQPNQCADVAAERLRWRLVIAGMPPEKGRPCPAATFNAREWYPFGCGNAAAWGPVPISSAYIFAYKFAWPGCNRPTRRQRRWLLRQAEAYHPQLVIWY